MVTQKIIIANCNPLLDEFQKALALKYNAFIIKKKEELNLDNLGLIDPDYIFFMHWSWIIPESVYGKFNCVVFHMTDLPFGRGGSPLQNLIVRGIKDTKVSALKVEKGLDTGDIYLKREMSLSGTATEIFKRTGDIIIEMIAEIILNKIEPKPQTGDPVYFTRRLPEESIVNDNMLSVIELYDFIRMLDADNYPHAFIENQNFRFEFTNAEIKNGKELSANVRIIKK